MDEPLGAQYAIHIAVHTLKDRCRSLQQRVTALEEENLNLRMQSTKITNENTTTDCDKLEFQNTKLTEQNQQLLNKLKMVTTENQELWNKLSRLNKVNQNLGIQLSKINDSLEQHSKNKEVHSPLIRSKTFTQDEPHTKVLQRNLEDNNRISSDLEEISLKIIDSLAQGKHDLDSLCSEIAEFQYNDNIITESCGFYFEEYDGNIIDEFNNVLEELKNTKQLLDAQNKIVQVVLKKVQILEEERSKFCDNLNKKLDKSTSISNEELEQLLIENYQMPESSLSNVDEKICPVCSKIFPSSTDYDILTEHVERHFSSGDYEVL